MKLKVKVESLKVLDFNPVRFANGEAGGEFGINHQAGIGNIGVITADAAWTGAKKNFSLLAGSGRCCRSFCPLLHTVSGISQSVGDRDGITEIREIDQ